jgi:hypothetical protein
MEQFYEVQPVEMGIQPRFGNVILRSPVRSLRGPRRTLARRAWLNDFVSHGLSHRRMDYSHAKLRSAAERSKTPSDA